MSNTTLQALMNQLESQGIYLQEAADLTGKSQWMFYGEGDDGDGLYYDTAEEAAEQAIKYYYENSTGIHESMDGDFDSAMTSAGFGTDEDYGYFGGNDDDYHDPD